MIKLFFNQNLIKMRNRVLTFGLAAAIVLVASAFGSVSEYAGGLISWEKKTHDFGQIVKGKNYNTEFSFRNTGNKPMMILSVKGSCGCTVTDYTKGEILPGKAGEVTAKYNASRLGSFQKTVTVTASVGGEPVILKLKGEVVDDC